MRWNMVIIVYAASIIAGCGDGSQSGLVVRETKTLTEGAALSYTLAAGSYTAKITSSNNGVVISWPGGAGAGCSTTSEIKVYSNSCTLSIQGQMVIENPTLLGLGGSEIVSIEVNRN